MAQKSTASKKKTTASRSSGSKSAGSRKSTGTASKTASKGASRETKRTIEKKKSFLESEIKLIAALLLVGFMLLTDLGFLGAVGGALLKLQKGLFGQGYFLLAVFILAAVAVAVKYRDTYFVKLKTVCVFVLLIDAAALIHLMFSGDGHEAATISVRELYTLSAGGASGGGLIGGCITNFLKGLVGYAGTYLILIALLIALIVIITEKSFASVARTGAEKTAKVMKNGADRTIEAARNGQQEYRRIHRERVIRREAEREERRLRALENDFPSVDDAQAGSRNIFYDTRQSGAIGNSNAVAAGTYDAADAYDADRAYQSRADADSSSGTYGSGTAPYVDNTGMYGEGNGAYGNAYSANSNSADSYGINGTNAYGNGADTDGIGAGAFVNGSGAFRNGENACVNADASADTRAFDDGRAYAERMARLNNASVNEAYLDTAINGVGRMDAAEIYANYGKDIIDGGNYGSTDNGGSAAADVPFAGAGYTNNQNTYGVSFDTAVLGQPLGNEDWQNAQAKNNEPVNVRAINYDSDEIPFDETEEDRYKSYAHILNSDVISLDTARLAGFAVMNSSERLAAASGIQINIHGNAAADNVKYGSDLNVSGNTVNAYGSNLDASGYAVNTSDNTVNASGDKVYINAGGTDTYGTGSSHTYGTDDRNTYGADNSGSHGLNNGTGAFTYGMPPAEPKHIDAFTGAGAESAIDVRAAYKRFGPGSDTDKLTHTDSADKAGLYFDVSHEDEDEASAAPAYGAAASASGNDGITDSPYGGDTVYNAYSNSGINNTADSNAAIEDNAYDGAGSKDNTDVNDAIAVDALRSINGYSDSDESSDHYVTATGKSMKSPDRYEADRILSQKLGKNAQSNVQAADSVNGAGNGQGNGSWNGSGSPSPGDRASQKAENGTQPKPRPKPRPYVFPRANLLEKGSANNLNSRDSLRKNAMKLQRVLRDFGVGVTVTNVIVGPRVSRYEITPDAGVKVSRITSLTGDIKLALAAREIRIEAPIPGKSAVGIEVPNEISTTVKFRDILESDEFKEARSKLCWGIGLDIGGNTVISDIAKMPHVLVAGTTGSGKSVGINSLIMSILYRATPQEVRMILVDPKQVEFTMYNGVPHLLTPVVTTPEKALSALNWAVAEMNRRYKLFNESGTRNIKGYNEKLEKANEGLSEELKLEKLPYILIIIDELSELMMHAKKDVESCIVSLAQLARAAGMHLVVATQRPSVDVITGLIKSNIPSRVAFKLPSVTDSRTILDTGGAEALLGNGDMLYKPGDKSSPIRVQGAFLSDEEVETVVNFVKKYNAPDPDPEIDAAIARQMELNLQSTQGGSNDRNDDDCNDEYFEDAGRLIIRSNKASIGGLQRKFKIGFNRAARIMDQLCEAGVVGDGEGTKERHILMNMDEFEAYLDSFN